MGLTWTPLALPGLVGGAAALLLAYVVLAARPEVAQNRRFAAALTVYGVANGAYTVRLLMETPADGYAMALAFMFAGLLLFPTTLLFAGTLSTPLARPFSGRFALWAATGSSAGLSLLLLARPDLFVADLRPFVHTPGFEFTNGPVWYWFGNLLPLVFLYAFVAAADAWRRAPVGIARRRARTFAIGFGVQNVGAALIILYLTGADMREPLPNHVNFLAMPILGLVGNAIVAYGILRFQLFEIDLRLKRGIRGGALAGAFFGVFFVVTEGAQVLFEQRVGPLVALIAAGALVFALHPLQRVADRVANAAMPHVEATPQYLEYRRMEIYREALESLLADGTVTQKERAALDRLRAKLGIHAPDAQALEDEVTGSRD